MTREVRIYTTPTCPYCKMAKKFLDDNGIKYQEFNIVEDKAAREELQNLVREPDYKVVRNILDEEKTICASLRNSRQNHKECESWLFAGYKKLRR